MGAGNSPSPGGGSDFVLIFLSQHSVIKRGFVQNEFKLTVEAWQSLPEGMIHTIPVRLDPCEVPEPFQPFHWADLFETDGFERIVHAIHLWIAQRPQAEPQDVL